MDKNVKRYKIKQGYKLRTLLSIIVATLISVSLPFILSEAFLYEKN